MTEQIIAGLMALFGLASVLLGAYFKGRSDKEKDDNTENLKVMQDVKKRAEDISRDSDDDYATRVRNSER